MFHMVSEHGNAHRKVKSERKRDDLIALGYHEVKVPAEGEEKPKKGKAKKNAAEE